jgi:hypothetical protein
VPAQEDELTLAHVEGDVHEGELTLGIGLGDVPESNHAGKI